ncbi:hypothetical protein V6Z11_A03G112300 [Gossypium hirsutum]
MDIDLRLPSGEQFVGENMRAEDGGEMHSSAVDMVTFKEDTNLEPLSGMEFESHGEAYSFYQEYARSMGFNTAIQNSRRSKTSREFIDAKFACSRYGTKREYDKSFNRPRARQSKQDPENATGRRSCSKTDCKASMHVKRRPDGKWVIHSFVKEHNHELLPAQAVSEQTRRMYAAMARQFAEYKNVVGLKNDPKNPFDKVDLGEDQRLKSLFWVDSKSRHDYSYFCDAVSFDTTYVTNKYKMPLALFIGVNHHYQCIPLGCALVSDESAATFSWLMQTWLKAMGGQSPRVLITNQDRTLKSVVAEIFPNTLHCFFLWHVLGKVSENLGHVIKQHGNLMAKFEKCIYRSWTDEEFGKRWWKILDRFELKDDEWMKSLYEDRKKWVPTYIMNVLLAGMSTVQRAESVNSFFDKYVHKKTTVQDFLKHYEAILQDRYEEEAKANSDSWSKVPALKSPSPFEKSVVGVYTHTLFKKFQIEVVGAIACHPKPENHDSTCSIFRVQDLEKNQDFIVTLNEMKAEVSCICRLYEYKGYLCRHAMVVLQINGHSAIPSQYILKRWTKEAKSRHFMSEESEQVQSRVQRYNDLFQRGMKLIEEGSLSQESYYIAFRSLEEAFGSCLSANTSNKSLAEAVASPTQGMICIEEDNQSRSTSKMNKKKNPTKKRKGNSEQEVMAVAPMDGLQQMDKLSSRSVALDSYFGAQPSVQGMVQLNLMAPRDNYYGNQQTIQGLGQLNTIATSHDGYYGTQQAMPGMGPMDFFRSPSFYIRDDPNVRVAQLHDDASRHT